MQTIDTPRGPAEVRLTLPDTPAAAASPALVLGHGAGGGIDAPDLRAAERAALAAGCPVALVLQPYRVAGRRSAPPAAALDEAWIAVLAELTAGPLSGRPLITGGRSSGARVACRTAATTGAAAVLCLAFPLLPPARAGAAKAPVSRLPELDGVAVPTLVVQGRTDRFGVPPEGPDRGVVVLTGDHGLKSDPDGVAAAVSAFVSRIAGK